MKIRYVKRFYYCPQNFFLKINLADSNKTDSYWTQWKYT